MNPPLLLFQNKRRTSQSEHSQQKQKQKTKQPLHISYPSIKQQIHIPHLIPLPLPRLKHIHRSHITHQLIIYPYPSLPPIFIFCAWIPVGVGYVELVVAAWCRMAVVVDHLLIHKCEKGGRKGMKDTCLQIDDILMRVIVSRLLVLSYLHRIRPTLPPTKDGKKQRHIPGPISNSGPNRTCFITLTTPPTLTS